jgi:ATP-dependent Clp protease ATP-binding subunit ClpA
MSRVTRLLAFPPLAADAGRSIVELELERSFGRPDLRERGISVSATPRLVEALARTGLSRRSGARGVQKAVYVAVAIPVAQLINEEDVRRSRLVVDALGDDEELEGVRIEIERWN